MMSHARSAWWLETKSYARIVPPPPRFTRQSQKEKMFLAFRICARPIFSKNGKDIFLFGVLPSKYSGRWRNNADEVLAKLFFGERICQNFGSFVFEFGCRKWKRRGLGRNFPFAPLISFGEIRAGVSAGLCNLVYLFWSTWIIALHSLPVNRCYPCNLACFFIKFDDCIFNSPAFINIQRFSK